MSETVLSSSRGRALKAAAPFIAGALVLGACSKSNPPVNEGAQTGNTTASAPSDTSGGGGSGGKSTGTTTTAAKSLNVKVYSDGFSYELGGVTLNSSTGELSVETTITNLGTENATPFTSLSLLSGDSTVSSSGSLKDRKDIVGGKNVKDTIVFDVDANFNPSSTTLVFGSENKDQAKVPLSGKGPNVTLAPVEQTNQLTSPITIGTMTLTPSKVEIRYDDPENHTTADKGKAYLVIAGNVKNASTDNTNFWSTGDMQLTAPDSQTYVADSVTPGNLGPTKSAETVMLWTIDDPNIGQLSGDYKLDIKDQSFGADGGKASADTITLSLSDKPTSDSGSTGTTQKATTTTGG